MGHCESPNLGFACFPGASASKVTPEFKVHCITFAAVMGESGSISVFVNKVLLENPSRPLTYGNLLFTLA